jgi:hypothetical protein
MYDVYLALLNDEEMAQISYDQFIFSSNLTEEELNAAIDEIRDKIYNAEAYSLIKEYGFGELLEIASIVIIALLGVLLLGLVLIAVYMSKAVKFITDFSITWDGLAPWKRTAKYAAGLGYFLSGALLVVALFGVFTFRYNLSLIIYLCASVSMFCFARFTAKVRYIMEELYRLELNV